MPENKIEQVVYDVLADAKGQDIQVLDVRKVTDITDFMVIASGTSSRHVVSMAEKIQEKLRELGRRALGTEGEKMGDWVLVDFGDVVVHIMRPQTRDFYNLEKLWSDGERADVAGQ
ncbi:MAG: ribosome silencing factor [Gammaproteobacteria bacterium]|nr:ribosome silencing factor [Gammaproteobacteria bacterium]